MKWFLLRFIYIFKILLYRMLNAECWCIYKKKYYIAVNDYKHILCCVFSNALIHSILYLPMWTSVLHLFNVFLLHFYVFSSFFIQVVERNQVMLKIELLCAPTTMWIWFSLQKKRDCFFVLLYRPYGETTLLFSYMVR